MSAFSSQSFSLSSISQFLMSLSTISISTSASIFGGSCTTRPPWSSHVPKPMAVMEEIMPNLVLSKVSAHSRHRATRLLAAAWRMASALMQRRQKVAICTDLTTPVIALCRFALASRRSADR